MGGWGQGLESGLLGPTLTLLKSPCSSDFVSGESGPLSWAWSAASRDLGLRKLVLATQLMGFQPLPGAIVHKPAYRHPAGGQTIRSYLEKVAAFGGLEKEGNGA